MTPTDPQKTSQEARRPRKPSGPPPREGARVWTPENVQRAVQCRNTQERQALALEIGTTEDAVRQVNVRWRAAHGKARHRHVWTEEEKTTVATIRGRAALAAFARKIGVTEQSALTQRAKVRSERGLRSRNHRWTAHEVATVQGLPTTGEVRRWAQRHSLSVDTALHHWKQGRKS